METKHHIQRLAVIVFCCVLGMGLSAQPEMKKFNPEQFTNDLHNYISKKAQLTADEAKAFFPLFDEMKEKERALYKNQRKGMKMPQTDEDFQRAIEEYDKIDLSLKKLQLTYHKKFLKVLPAKKVFWVIHAEDEYRRYFLRNMTKGFGFQFGKHKKTFNK